jgi:hypothetical protein
MVVDSGRRRLLVFDVDWELWALPLEGDAVWERLEVGGAKPTGTFGHSVILDEARDRLVLYGGSPARVWTVGLSNVRSWSEIVSVNGGPGVRTGHTGLYDGLRGAMIVWGGSTDIAPWRLSLEGEPVWTRLVPDGSYPVWRAGMTAVLDSERDQLVVSADRVVNRVLRLWALPLSGDGLWTTMASPPLPPMDPPNVETFETFRTSYDAAHDQLVLFIRRWYAGGIFTQTVYLLPLDAPATGWTLYQHFFNPLESFGVGIDGVSGMLIAYGQASERFGLGVIQVVKAAISGVPTWGIHWRTPGSRTLPSLAWDEKREQMLLYGGYATGRGPFSSTSYFPVFERSLWKLESPGPAVWLPAKVKTEGPPDLMNSAGVYDRIHDTFLALGGVTASYSSCPCWSVALSYPIQNSWAVTPESEEVWAPVPPLPMVYGHTVIQDARNNRAIMMGGRREQCGCCGSCTTTLNQMVLTWSPGASQWEELVTTGGGPVAISSHTAVYDPVRHQIIVFGGRTPSGSPGTWMLSLDDNHWTQPTFSGPVPPARQDHKAIYDPLRDRMVIVGGVTPTGGTLSDTWALNLAGTPTWGQMSPQGVFPSDGVQRGAAAYDPVRDAMVFVQWTTWFLAFGDPLGSVAIDVRPGSSANVVNPHSGGVLPVAILGASNFNAQELDELTLRLTASGHELGTTASRHGAIRDVNHDGYPDMVVSFDLTGAGGPLTDPVVTVEGRTREGGRIRGRDQVRWVGSATNSLELPTGKPLRLNVLQNPVREALILSLSVPPGASAKLELLDIAGRLVFLRIIPEGTDDTASLPETAGLSSGVYMLRLTNKAEVVTRRIVVAH